MTESAKHTYLRSHLLSGEMLKLDLQAEAAAVLAEAKQATVGRAARTLLKEGPLRLTILGLSAGSSLHEHRAGGPVSIDVRQGSVVVTAQGGSEPLGEGDILVFGSNISHSVTAQSDAVLLLSIAIVEPQAQG